MSQISKIWEYKSRTSCWRDERKKRKTLIGDWWSSNATNLTFSTCQEQSRRSNYPVHWEISLPNLRQICFVQDQINGTCKNVAEVDSIVEFVSCTILRAAKFLNDLFTIGSIHRARKVCRVFRKITGFIGAQGNFHRDMNRSLRKILLFRMSWKF